MIYWVIVLFVVVPSLISRTFGKDNEFGSLITIAIIYFVIKGLNLKKLLKNKLGSGALAAKPAVLENAKANNGESLSDNSTSEAMSEIMAMLDGPRLNTNNKNLQNYDAIEKLKKNGKYLQIALNGSRSEALAIVSELPISTKIILEAGTPLIKQAGLKVIRDIAAARPGSYIVADLKTSDLAEREVVDVSRAGANAAVVLGVAPIITLDKFIAECQKFGIDSMIDMMNVSDPLVILKKIKKAPTAVIVHRGVDETESEQGKMIPYFQINKIKGFSNVKVSIAGGDSIREIESSFFNGADIVVVWKDFMNSDGSFIKTVNKFLKFVK